MATRKKRAAPARDAQAAQPCPRPQAREAPARASPSRALGARPGRRRPRAGHRPLARLGRGTGGLAPLRLAALRGRLRGSARPARAARDRRADARTSALVDLRPFRTGLVVGLWADGRARRGARGRRRWCARRRPGKGARRRGGADSRRRSPPGRGAARHRCSAGAVSAAQGTLCGRPERGPPLHREHRMGRLERFPRPPPTRAALGGRRAGPARSGRRDGSLPGRRGLDAVIGAAAFAATPQEETDRRRRCARVRRAGERSRVQASRPLAAEAEPAQPGRLGRRQRPHSAGARADARALRSGGKPWWGRSRGHASSHELQLAPGTKVSKVAGLKDDLSYALATTEIRILAPIPGKQAVGVEVPNLAPRMVTLGDIYEDLPGRQAHCPSGWARTSRGTRCGPTLRGCRTS